MVIIFLGLLAGFVLASSCGSRQSPETRAERLAREALKMVRLEQKAMAGEIALEGKLKTADSLFLALLKIKPSSLREYVRTGGGAGKKEIETFLDMAGRFKAMPGDNDPAAVISAVLAGALERANRSSFLMDGYAAAFQMNMEVERDGTVLQDFIPFLVTLGTPLTFRDLGLDKAGRPRLEELAAQAAARTGKMPYSTGPFDYFITMVKLDSWGSKFSGQVTADTLALRLMAFPEFRKIEPALKNLQPVRLGFLGDSHMDKIHWCTQAPFPEIIAALFRKINPGVTVINAGKGGDDSGEALARIDTALIAKGPELAFVMLGGNDCRHYGRPGPAVTPEQYKKNISEIVTRLARAGSRTVLLGYPRSPELSGPDLEVFLASQKNLLSVRDLLKTGWIDIAAVINQGDQESHFAVDRIHFSPQGHLLIAQRILEYLSKPGA